MSSDPSGSVLLVGTFTERMPHAVGRADGILGCRFEGAGGESGELLARARNPTHVISSADGSRVYAVSETPESDGTPGGSVHAYAMDRETLTLTHLNTVLTNAPLPNHLCVDPLSEFLVVTHYSGWIVVFALGADGAIGAQTGSIQHVGSGTHPRQQSAHPHMAAFEPSGRNLIVADLGADALFSYTLTEDGGLEERAATCVRTAPGSGPRQVVFRRDRPAMLLVTELDNRLVEFARDGEAWVEQSSVSMLPPEFVGESEAGGICLSSSGQHLFAANRGPDMLTMFALNGGREAPEMVHVASAAGITPRELAVSADGRYLLCANQNSDAISVFEVDEHSPRLRHAGSIPALSPACLSFI